MILEFDPIFEELKSRTELKSRGMEGDWEPFVITDSEKEIVQVFFRDAADDISNRMTGYFTLKDFEDTELLTLNIEGEVPEKLMKRLIINKILWEWWDSVGLSELSEQPLADYEVGLRKLKTVLVKPGFTEPATRPYF